MKKRCWYEIVIEGDFDTDLLLGALHSSNCLGAVEEKSRMKAYFSPENCPSENQIKCILDQFGVKDVKIHVRKLFDDGWSKNWERFFEPIYIGKRIYIRPPWKEPPSGNFIDIIINPGGAFGTGTHPTTQMALYFLERYLKEGMKVLDAGCGSGILAIASIKLGATQVTCVDIDEEVRQNFYENIHLNGIIKEAVELKICDVAGIKNFEFDLIVSNIDINSSIKLLNSVRSSGRFPHYLIFTGILKKDMKNFMEQLRKMGLNVTNVGTLKEWGAIVV